VVAAAVIAAAGFDDIPARLAVMASAVAGCTAAMADTGAGVAVAALAYLLFNGFLVNQHGELTWDGTASVWHLAVFTLAIGLGLIWRYICYIRARAAMAVELVELINTQISDDKESHGA
jgi:hypothetical protein